MPLITITYIKEGKPISIICGCTFEQYDTYMKCKDINSHTIPTSFFTQYVESKNKTVSDIDKFTSYTVEERKDFAITWVHSNIINIDVIKKLLHGFDLDYSEFIDSYCSYLKSIN